MTAGAQGPASLLGQTIGSYTLERVLGTGATGVTFLGRLSEAMPAANNEMEQPRSVAPGVQESALPAGGMHLPDAVAIKLLILPWQLDEVDRREFQFRFAREADILRDLHHPHIVALLDSGESDGYLYTVLPYLSGGSLDVLIRQATNGLLPLGMTVTYVTQIGSALDYAHSQGVLHRDVKPSNVLLDAQRDAYLSDFSIARILSGEASRHTTAGRILGTPSYMAPEQFSGDVVGPAADIYSLGVVAYELVTGRLPFVGDTLMDVMRSTVQDTPPPPRHFRPDLPPPAAAAIMKCLSKRPEERFESAEAFAHAYSTGLQGVWVPGLTAYDLPSFEAARGRQTTYTTLTTGGIPATYYSNTLPFPSRVARSKERPRLSLFLSSILIAILHLFGPRRPSVRSPRHRRQVDALADATMLFPRGFADELRLLSDDQVRIMHAGNVAAGKPPYHGVRIGTRSLLFRVMKEREWSLAAPQLEDAVNLSGAELGRIDLSEMDLLDVNLGEAKLARANFHDAYLTRCNLERADLREANLNSAYLNRVSLRGANLRGADLSGCRLYKVDLRGADLRMARLDPGTLLRLCKFDDNTRISDVVWNGALLSQMEWSRTPIFAEEKAIKSAVTRRERIHMHHVAARGYRGLSIALRAQGLLDEAATYRLREQRLERRALFLERRFLRWGFSGVLNIVAGYGENPGRAILAYLITVIGFADLYASMSQRVGPVLSYPAAFVFSLTSFHGRGFFPGSIPSLMDPLVIFAAAEAVVGLFIELIFIATFGRRFLGN